MKMLGNTMAATVVGLSLVAASGSGVEAKSSAMSINERGERTMEVSFADLNLDDADGRKSLDGRIRRAAQRCCGKPRGKVSVREAGDYSMCYKQSLTRANQAIAEYRSREDAGTRMAASDRSLIVLAR